jgi:hypothetical protein
MCPTVIVNETLELRKDGGCHTDASIALFNRSNILIPWEMALEEATKRLPAEQTDKRRTAFWVPGRKVGICTTGKRGWNLEKYAWMHRSYQW